MLPLTILITCWVLITLIKQMKSFGMIIGTQRGLYKKKKIGHGIVYDAVSSINAKLSSVILDKALNWSYVRCDDLVTILCNLSWIAIGECDKAVWIPSKSGTFCASSAWDQIRLRRLTIDWWKIVWSKGIPRHAFITWLALRDRLSTNERIVSWGISCDILCVLCRTSIENGDHIFFECPFFQRIWSIIKRWCCQEGLDD